LPASLKAPGAILLLSTYELGRQPLSLASPIALLERSGFSPAALDLAVERLDLEAVGRARLAAIAVPMHTALRLGARALDRVRSLNRSCVVGLYGLYATLNAERLLARGADFVIGGEFEEPLVGLAERLDATGAGPPALDLPGVRTAGRPEGPWLRKTAFAVPRRDGLPPLDMYAALEYDGERRVAGQVEASRGCLHHCRHCPLPPVYDGRFFIVPRDIVLADIRNQVAAGARHITFGDADFLNGPGHSLTILRAMRGEFPGLSFDFTAKIEHLLKHRDVLPEMARLGCLFIVSAVESLSDRVLAILDKGHTRADVHVALDVTRRAGIALRPSLVPFTPWTSLEDYLDLLEFVERQDLIDHIDPIQLVIRLLLPPGSLLIDRPEMKPHLGALDPDRFTFRWSHPDSRMDRLHEDLSALVEKAALGGEDPRVTFHRIAARAARAAGRTENFPPLAPPASDWPATAATVSDAAAPSARRDKGRPPRLTEPWFC
jgi:radical SAM superfamily enzyme YgiQ (UPF0313 family)